MMAHKPHHNPSAVNTGSAENNLFLDELVQDFDISLSGFGCDNTNGSLIRDLNQVINTLGDNIVKVEAIDSEENAQDSTDAQVKYFRATPESPQSNDSCGSYASTDSDKKLAKSMSYTELAPNRIKTEPERKTPKRLCFKGLSTEELSPISSVSSSMESSSMDQKFVSNNSDSSQTTVNTSLNEDNSYGYSWRRYSKTDAPSVHTKMRSVQIGQTIKAEPERRLFQYILGAPTASGVKLGAMTMTYLNQGQPYEIRLKKVSDIPNNDGKNLKTAIRLGFVEKRLQYRESEEMANWCKLHSKDRILDVDFALSYGIFDVQINSSKSNCLEFVWNPNREASIFVKLNCISTEFTSKRHGGERGTPLRLVIETFSTVIPQIPKLDSAQCLVKVFKSKGADRKHKTDRERIAKQVDSSLYYQPSYDCTLFTTFNDDDILVRTSSPTNIDCPSPNTCSSYTPIDSPRPSVQLNVATSSTTCYQSPQSTNPSEESITPSMAVTNGLPSDATPAQTFEWLNKNRFNKLTDVLMNFSSEDLRRLSREDLIQICGLSDGIRLYNCIHAIQSTTRLTIFVTTDGKVHNAIYLKALTTEELRDRLIEALGITCITIKNFYLIGPNDIRIKVTNNVVLNVKNESIYSCSLDKVDDDYDLVLQSAPF